MHWIFVEQVELSLHRLLTDDWYFLGNSKPTHEVQEKHLAKKIDVKYLYFFVFPFSRWKTIFKIFFEQSIEWSNKESYQILHFDACSSYIVADKSTMCCILQESIILLCGCFCTNNQSWDIKSYRQYEPDVLSKETKQLYFQKLPFRGQRKLELHPNLLEMHQKNDVPPSIHEADAIAYVKVAEDLKHLCFFL